MMFDEQKKAYYAGYLDGMRERQKMFFEPIGFTQEELEQLRSEWARKDQNTLTRIWDWFVGLFPK